jgi:hypothetical protein
VNKIREFINKNPWLGWAIAVLLLVAGAVVYFRFNPSRTEYSLARMTEDVTIRCSETGKEWKMPRGRMEAELLGRSGQIDPTLGITNPDTGRPTGFPVTEWESTVERLNKAKADMAARGPGAARGGGGSSKKK